MPDSTIHALLDLYPVELGRIDRSYDEIHGGRSGAQVLLVDVVGSGHPDAYTGKAYAKIDTPDRTRLEYEKHASARQGLERSIPDVLCKPLYGDKGFSLLLYRPANEAIIGARSLVQVLGEYLKNQHTSDRLVLQIDQLVTQALAPWQDVNVLVNKRKPQDPLTLVRELINRGGEDRFYNLEERFAAHFGLSKTSQMLMFRAKVHSPNHAIFLPNPLHYALTPSNFKDLTLARTPIHGDLHAGNVICRLEIDGRLAPQMPQMLDMALYESQGLVFFDLAYLELDILCQCLPVTDESQWSNWLTILRHLNSSVVMPEDKPPGALPEAAWILIRPIRKRAESLIDEITERSQTIGEQYRASWWLAGWAAGLVMARRSLHSAPWRRSAALLSSAWALNHLLELWDIRYGDTTQLLDWRGESGLQSNPTIFRMGQREGKLKNVPSLPTYKLERQEDLREIRSLVLTSNSKTGTTGRVAVQGMGGIGKTVLVASVCQDPEVRQAFPDGIYWLTFGMQPQVTNLQAQLAQWIEGQPTTLSDVDSLRYLLIRLLSDKKCLLVLDDVWDNAHLQGFRSLGSDVRLIVTTRKQAVVTALDAVSYAIPTLTDGQARKLLADASEHNSLELPNGAETILKECGGLPLALAMIGSALKNKPADRWDDVGMELKAAHIDEFNAQSVEYPEYKNLWAVFDVSVAELDPKIQACYLDFAVFPDDVSVPQATLATFWKTRGMDGRAVRRTIEQLFEAALLMRDGSGVKLHDLQMDYVRLRVQKEQGDLNGLHAQLLNAYNPTRLSWHKITHDGYLYQRLAYHLKALSQLDELHELVTGSPDWRDAKFNACEGDASYADDVLTLLGKYQDPLSPNDVIRVAQLRAAQQVIRNRTSRYTDTDLKTLTWLGRLGEAFSYARLRPHPEKRFEGLQAIREALKAKPDAQNEASLQQVTHEMLEEISSVVQFEDSDCWTVFLTSLVREGQIKEARDAAQTIRHPESRALGLRTVATAQLEKDQTQANALFDEALQAAHSIVFRPNRNKALTDIESARSQQRISGAENGTGSLEHINERNGTFRLWIERLMGERRDSIGQDEIVKALRGMADTVVQSGSPGRESLITIDVNDRDESLKDIATVQIAEKAYEDAEQTALHIINVDDRVTILSEIAAALAQSGSADAERVFKQAEESARIIDNTDRRATALETLVAGLARAQAYNYAERVASRIKHKDWRASALTTIITSLIEARAYTHAEQIAYQIEDPQKRILPLIKLASALAKAQPADAARVFAESEALARTIELPDRRVSILSALGAALMGAQLVDAERIFAEVEELARGIEQTDRRVSALSTLGVALAQAQSSDAERIFAEAETLARSIETDKRTTALQELAAALADARLYDLAEQTIYSIDPADKQISALRNLATTLIEAGFYERAEQIANRIEPPEMSVPVLSMLASALAQERLSYAKKMFAQAEEMARSIKPVEKRFNVLRELALALAPADFAHAEQLFAQAEEIASKIENVDSRAYRLSDLAAALAEAQMYKQAEETILSIKGDLQAQSWRDLAAALAHAKQFEAAFRVVGTQEMPEYLLCVGKWCDALETWEEGLFVQVLRATLSILAWEQDRWRGVSDALMLHFPQGLALLIGVDSLASEKSSSHLVAAEDARSVARFLRYEAGYGDVRLLTNEQATRENIYQGLRWLANQAAANPEATAFIYFSIEGASLPDGRAYLVSYDAQGTEPHTPPIAISELDEWLGHVRAKQSIVFFDWRRAAHTPLPFTLPDVSTMTSSRGRVLIAACAPDQESYTAPSHQHTLFNEVLLELLHQPGEVGLLILWQKLQAEIKARAAEQGCEQMPRLNTIDYDRMIVVKNPPSEA